LKTPLLVTVIIPTYNYAKYICEAIDSVLASNFPQDEIEIIVVDDGSTDDTPDKVRVYGERIRYLSQDNQGKALATSVGIDYAQGKYLFNLDADDYFLPEKIRQVVSLFDADDEILHVGHPALCWNIVSGTKQREPLPERLTGRKLKGKEVLLDFYKQRILFGGGSTFAARTEALKLYAIPKDVDMYIDEYLILMTLNKGYTYFIEQPLSVWRIHDENFSGLSARYSIGSLDKAARSMNSLNAVLSLVLAGDFEPDLKLLYALKAKVSQLAMKERAGEKSYGDVLDLWKCLARTFGRFGKESFDIMRCYTVLNRTLPTPALQLARRAAGKAV
jgi:glycosyltransferase involved in cell wall biosynthesis